MKKNITSGFFLMLFASLASAQHLNMYKKDEGKGLRPDSAAMAKASAAFEKKSFETNGITLPYRLMLPAGYDASKQYPLVLFLHGKGERGSENEKQLTHGAALFAKDDIRQKFPAIVVFPQCPENSYWSNVNITLDPATKKTIHQFRPDGEPTVAMSAAMDLVKHVIADYPVKKDQVYVVGLSMGGMGTYEIVRRMPATFAGAIAICGGADTTTVKAIKKTAFWIIHGAKDQEVSPKFSEDMIQALQKFYTAAEMQYTVYPDAGHNSWDNAFAEPSLLPWLFAQTLMK